MQETRLFGGRIGMPRNHRLIPLFDRFGRMFLSVFLHPIQNCLIVFQLVSCLLERVAVEFEKREQMFIEPNGFVIVTVKQTFAVQPAPYRSDAANARNRRVSRTDCADAVYALKLNVVKLPAADAQPDLENWTPARAKPSALVARAILPVSGRSDRWRAGRKTSRLFPR